MWTTLASMLQEISPFRRICTGFLLGAVIDSETKKESDTTYLRAAWLLMPVLLAGMGVINVYILYQTYQVYTLWDRRD